MHQVIVHSDETNKSMAMAHHDHHDNGTTVWGNGRAAPMVINSGTDQWRIKCVAQWRRQRVCSDTVTSRLDDRQWRRAIQYRSAEWGMTMVQGNATEYNACSESCKFGQRQGKEYWQAQERVAGAREGGLGPAPGQLKVYRARGRR